MASRLIAGLFALLLFTPTARALSICGYFDEDPAPECTRWQCNTAERSWGLVPTVSGSRCAGGTCDGEGRCVAGTGTIYPAYYIASVIYAPPGRGSVVTYGTESSIGTTTSTTSSWKTSTAGEVSSKASVGTASIGTSYSFAKTWSGASTRTLDVIRTETSGMNVPGPNSDEVDHDYDQIHLLLNAKINTIVYTSGAVAWSLDLSNVSLLPVYVGLLKGSMPLPNNIAAAFAKHGITTADYSQILGADPFAADRNGELVPDPSRFEWVNRFPYVENQNTYPYGLSNKYLSSTQTSSEHSFTVGATHTAGVLNLSLKASTSFTFTNSSSVKNTFGKGFTQSLRIGMPSAAYLGTNYSVEVYVDKIYKTFLFRLAAP